MSARGWLESVRPRSIGTKVLAALLGLGVLSLGVAAVRGTWSWGDFGFLALLVAIYTLTLAGSAQKLSQTRALTIALVATWVGVGLFLLLGTWTVLRVTDEPGGDSGSVLGISILMGCWALLGVGLAVPYSRKLLRLLRVAREQEDKSGI